MKCYTRFVIVVTMIGSLVGCGEPEKKKADEAVVEAGFFQNARLIPGDGSPALENIFFTVEGGKITKIGTRQEVAAPKGATHVDLEGQFTVMPVLINLHAHPGLAKAGSFGPQNYSRSSVINDLNRYGYYGVQYVVALGSDTGDAAMQIRQERKEGKLEGAQLLTAGRGITAKGGWPTPLLKDIPYEVSSEAEARKAVGELAASKVDLIKIWVDDNMGQVPKLSPQISRAVIDEAHKRNLKAVAHVFYLADAKELVAAGIDGLVHSIRDRDVDDALINEMKAKNVFYTPTLTAHESKFTYADKPSWIGEQSMREVYPAQLTAFLVDETVIGKIKRDPNLSKFREQYATAVKNLKKMADGGVRIALGTDSGIANTFTGYFEHRELELMEAAGMTPSDVVKAATSTPAAILGMADNGTLAVGKNASFLILTANPLEKARNSREIYKIYVNGHEMDRPGILSKIETDVPKVTDADRQTERKAAADDAQKKFDEKLPHFGKFPAGETLRAGGFAVPTPKYSKASAKGNVVTVSYPPASAADLREFYVAAFPKFGAWTPAGACWERKHAVTGKLNSACVETSNGQAIITVTEK